MKKLWFAVLLAFLCMTLTVARANAPNVKPTGNHDSSNCSVSIGWSCDANNYDQAITIHFYADGPWKKGTLIGTTTANLAREAAVGTICGGNSNHGFSFPTPASLLDGKPHVIYAYAINTPNGSNPLLWGSKKSITCTSDGTAVVPLSPSKKSIDVFLIAGQSNAVGYGDVSQSTVRSPGKVLRYYSGKISDAIDPIGGPIEVGGGSAWPTFGSTYYTTTGRSVVFVPTAIGGTSQTAASQIVANASGNWDINGTLVNDSMNSLDSAMAALSGAGYAPTFKGVLWSQGETDAMGINSGIITGSDYKNALVSMLSRYRARYGASMPFYIFQTGTEKPGTETGNLSDYTYAAVRNDSGYAEVRKIQSEIPVSDKFTYVVFAGAVGFPSRGFMTDTWHYTQNGYNEMGTIGAQNVIKYSNALSSATGSSTGSTVKSKKKKRKVPTF